MLDYLQLCIYIDKNKDMIFAAYKENKAGLVVMSEPYEYVDCAEWENVSEHIIKMINEIAKQPITEDTGSNIMKIICKGKGFKQFTKKHMCIDAAYKISKKSLSYQMHQDKGMVRMEYTRGLSVKRTARNIAAHVILY